MLLTFTQINLLKSFRLRLGYGSYNTQEFYGRVSGPLANTDWSYIFAITKESSDGFSKNELTQNNFDTKDFTSFNTKLRYNPSSPLDITLGYTKSLSDDGGSPFKINTKENPYLIDNEPTDDSVNMDIDMLSLVMRYKTNNYTFTSATSYSKQTVLKNDYVAILGGLNMDFDINIQEITQEFRLKQSFENSDLVVGAFYSDKLQFDYVENQTLLSIPLSSNNSLKNPDENIALFTQYKHYIGENYLVMAGIRYQETKRSFSREMNNFGAPSTQASSETVWSHALPTLSLSYYTEDDSHTYLTYSQGYRPGGYNYRSVDALVPYEPETTNSLELGHKRFINKHGSLNAALFYNYIENLRVNTFDDNLANTTLNAQEAYSYGAEIEVNYKKDALYLFMTAGIIQTKMTQMDTNPEYEGNKIIGVPNITANIGGRYTLFQNYYIQSDLKYMGERYYNIANSAKENDYTLFNLGFGYKKDGLEILLYTNNIFNEEYVDFMIYTPSNDYYHFGDPRVLGFTLSQGF
ncbi:TonB-dependent receptor [Candidatus Sulfurimonas baltica]|uniref:TonB-dependent receptor n=1 Tax=Candidatus Sulfurimonas baltica TaxID=2740404 RepID=A0A7S7LT14_9BACT|nr:TonB-dependent receptor [Candidatus Sulfurimonas baltica]QOY51002.1 TonB-dependent receptor [Candidatus Sulfurimonas baltica]